jgi:indolepyruvate ferredoxin oxidoreductase
LRRFERALPGEYQAAIDAVLPRLGALDRTVVLTLAELPDSIRGYEHLKLERIARFREDLAVQQANLAAKSSRSA